MAIKIPSGEQWTRGEEGQPLAGGEVCWGRQGRGRGGRDKNGRGQAVRADKEAEASEGPRLRAGVWLCTCLLGDDSTPTMGTPFGLPQGYRV